MSWWGGGEGLLLWGNRDNAQQWNKDWSLQSMTRSVFWPSCVMGVWIASELVNDQYRDLNNLV